MTVVNDGLYALANILATEVGSTIWGTDTTAISITDTDLGSPVSASAKLPIIQISNNSITVTHSLSATEANGSTYTEHGAYFDSGSLLNRTLNPGFEKDNTIELTQITLYNINRG